MKNALAHLILRLCERTRTLRHVKIDVGVKVGGKTVVYPLGGHDQLNHVGVHEVHLLEVMRDVLARREGAVLDVGANIGQTLVKFLALGDGRPYVAFEPSVAAAAQVKKLAEANSAENVHVIPAALSDESGVRRLSTSGPFDVSATLVPEVHRDGYFTHGDYVSVLRGDDVVDAMGLKVALVKVDAEGAEAHVLAGLSRVIERDRPAVICELIPDVGIQARKTGTSKVLSLFDSWGYERTFIAKWEHLFQPSELAPRRGRQVTAAPSKGIPARPLPASSVPQQVM